MENAPLNAHNKQEYPPMHTAEHILNATMVGLFGCGRAVNAHIERKKSKCDYALATAPTDAQIQTVEQRVNDVIALNLVVTKEILSIADAAAMVDISRLPAGVETLRIVRIGDYDACACIGEHVERTGQIGEFRVISYNFDNGILRIRFKLIEPSL